MQLSIALLALIKVSTALTARAAEKLFTVEFAPGDIQTVTEEEKWTLKEVSLKQGPYDCDANDAFTATQELHRHH